MVAGLVTGDSIVNPDTKLTGAGVNTIIDRVAKVDPAGKKVFLASGTELAYDKLVLGTGSSPVMPPITGHDLDGVFILRSLKHAEAMRTFLADKKPGTRKYFYGAIGLLLTGLLVLAVGAVYSVPLIVGLGLLG